jgi:hypothetical protein
MGHDGHALLFMGQFSVFTYFRPFLEQVTRVDVSTLSLILLGLGAAGLVAMRSSGGSLPRLCGAHCSPCRWCRAGGAGFGAMGRVVPTGSDGAVGPSAPPLRWHGGRGWRAPCPMMPRQRAD